jgi:hypothetical protein
MNPQANARPAVVQHHALDVVDAQVRDNMFCAGVPEVKRPE